MIKFSVEHHHKWGVKLRLRMYCAHHNAFIPFGIIQCRPYLDCCLRIVQHLNPEPCVKCRWKFGVWLRYQLSHSIKHLLCFTYQLELTTECGKVRGGSRRQMFVVSAVATYVCVYDITDAIYIKLNVPITLIEHHKLTLLLWPICKLTRTIVMSNAWDNNRIMKTYFKLFQGSFIYSISDQDHLVCLDEMVNVTRIYWG